VQSGRWAQKPWPPPTRSPAGTGAAIRSDRARLLPRSWRRHLPLLAGLTLLWVGGWAVVVHGTRGPVGIERPLNDLLTDNKLPLFGVATFFSHVGDPPVFAVLALLMLGVCALVRSGRAAVTLAVAMGVTLVACEGLKLVVARRQIFFALTFPSGHVAVTSVFATVVVLLCRRRGPVGVRLSRPVCVALMVAAVGAVVAVAASMVTLGLHYVSDTTAAAPIGVVVTLLAAAAVDSLAGRSAPGR
jgi:membrane-associated phospholipid phosphatase